MPNTWRAPSGRPDDHPLRLAGPPTGRRAPCFCGVALGSELDIGQPAELLVPREEPRPEPTRRGVADRIGIRQRGAGELQGHRLEDPIVLHVHDERAEACELPLRFLVPTLAENRQVQFHEIPEGREEFRSEVSAEPVVPFDDLDQRERIEEESRRPYQPLRSSFFSFWVSTFQSRREPNASITPLDRCTSRNTSSPGSRWSLLATPLGITTPREEPHRRIFALVAATCSDTLYLIYSLIAMVAERNS